MAAGQIRHNSRRIRRRHFRSLDACREVYLKSTEDEGAWAIAPLQSIHYTGRCPAKHSGESIVAETSVRPSLCPTTLAIG